MQVLFGIMKCASGRAFERLCVSLNIFVCECSADVRLRSASSANDAERVIDLNTSFIAWARASEQVSQGEDDLIIAGPICTCCGEGGTAAPWAHLDAVWSNCHCCRTVVYHEKRLRLKEKGLERSAP